MKKQVEVAFDDLDERIEAVKTLTFIVDGKSYEIDLGERNLERFHRVLEPFTAVARTEAPPVKRSAPAKKRVRKSRAKAKTGTAKTATKAAAPKPSSKNSPTPYQIRAWARETGFPIGKAGRVSAEARKAFLEAHTSKPTVETLKDASEKGALSDAA